MFYRIAGIADGRYGELSAARFVALCERTFSYRGAMRALAEAQAEGDDPDEVRRLDSKEDEELEDEVPPQDLDGLELTMDVRT